MSEKVIKPCAVVPPNLYVHREADKQLKQIIHDMGRPGYVLVSRQMGKTNLLLNAKRETDSEKDIFAYLDVSNSFSDIRDFFRNIVDTVLEANIKGFVGLAKVIRESRKESFELQPHKEHEFELRTILGAISGKLIICLDEIDALTKVDYSDKVFSQIRSMYFSGRTNFPDFSRLTYVLSGVADPSELIKNKAISPFNIGAKIYLNDFTLQETLDFVTQSSMVLEVRIVERIYHWASGNPRLTWEVCSELESKIISEVAVDELSVDELVSNLYLANFDLPPVDHIRTIAAADREISNAVMSIHYGKSNSLTDRVKDRLYLAGITTSKATDGSIRFRNRIVAEALSEKWISDLEKSLLSVSERVLQYFDAEEFDGIVTLYENNHNNECNDISVETQFKIGYAYAKTNQHLQALTVFQKAAIGLNGGDNYYVLNYWMGICNLVAGSVETAIDNFSTIVNRENARAQGVEYFQSCMNLAVAYFRDIFDEEYTPNFDEKVSKILTILNDVINSEGEVRALRNDIIARQLSCTAYYQLHSLYSWKKDISSAILSLDKGVEYCADSSIVKFLIAKSQLVVDDAGKKKLVEQCVTEIVERNFLPRVNKQNNPLLLSDDDFSNILFLLAQHRSYDFFSSLVNYIFDSEDGRAYSCAGLLYRAAIRAGRVKDHAALFWITNSAVALLTGRAKKDELRRLLSLSLVMSNSFDAGDLKEKFIQDFLSDESPLPLSDLSAIYVMVIAEIENDNIAAARHIVNSSISGWSKTSESYEEDLRWQLADCVLRYLAVLVRTVEKNPAEISELVQLQVEITRLQDQSLPYISKSVNATILKTLGTIIKLQKKVLVKQALDGLDRKCTVTIRFADGRLKKGKLKGLLAFIKSGRAELVDPPVI